MQLAPFNSSSPAAPDDVASSVNVASRPHSVSARRMRRWGGVLLAIIVLLVIAPRVTTWLLARSDVAHAPKDLPRLAAGEQRAAIVLGAGVVGDRPTPLLKDRIDGAVALLASGRVDLLLMSGDNTTEYYDEPSAMRTYAIEQGAPPHLVAVDYAGRRTWDTCMRAVEVFGIEQAVVVTNAFHVDRALATCRAAGVDAMGLSVSDAHHTTGNRARWRMRELAATWRALADAWVLRPAPAVGGERIDPYEPCELLASLAPSVAEDAAADFAQFDC